MYVLSACVNLPARLVHLHIAHVRMTLRIPSIDAQSPNTTLIVLSDERLRDFNGIL
jgi:hypothetical protein